MQVCTPRPAGDAAHDRPTDRTPFIERPLREMREREKGNFAQGPAMILLVALLSIGLFVFALTVLVGLYLPLESP